MYLSLAGRVTLFKSVLFAIPTFWTQVFVLPKRIIHFIDVIRRRFSAKPSKNALILWDIVRTPTMSGGPDY